MYICETKAILLLETKKILKMTYKIVKNGHVVKANSLTKEEAVNQLAIIVDDCAMATNYYLTDENHTITNPDNGRVIFEAGDESATIGDNSFEIVEEVEN